MMIQKIATGTSALVLCLTLATTAIANTNGPVEPHPDYPECLRFPVLNSKGEVLYWNFKGYCQRAACDADPRGDDC